MSYKKCVEINLDKDISGLTNEQKKAYKDELFQRYDEIYNELSQNFTPAIAAREAAERVKKQKTYEKKLRQYRKLLQFSSWAEIKKDMNEFVTPTGKKDIYEGAKAILTHDQATKHATLGGMIKSVENDANSRISEFLGRFKRNVFTKVRNQEELNQSVLYVLGKEGEYSDIVKEIGESMRDTFDYLRERFNRAGGTIGKIDNYFPVTHNAIAVANKGFNEWFSTINDLIDPSKMINPRTNEPFETVTKSITGNNLVSIKSTRQIKDFDDAMKDVYKSITSNGYNKVDPGKSGFAKSIANKRADHRFLAFKNSDAFMKYNDEFGEGNPFDVFLSHVQSMSRDIGIMERLGPNPNATLKYMQMTIKKEAETSELTGAAKQRLINKSNKAQKRISDYYSHLSGDANSPVDSVVGNWFAGLRNILTSAQLGGAFISAITDLNSSRVTRQMAGLSQWNTLRDVIKYMAIGQKGIDRGKVAIRLGLISEGWTALASHQMRMVGEITGPELSRRLSDVVMKASLLSPWTQANRWAFGQEFLGFMADNSNKAFGELDEAFRKTLDNYGFDSTLWDTLRKTDKWVDEESGADFFSIENLRKRTDLTDRQKDRLSNKILGMINNETNFAVPSASLKGKVFFAGGTKAGTVEGELTRSLLMYKNFGVTVINTHIMRMITQTGWNKLSYFVNFVVASSILGGVALQMKDIARGRDPRPIDGKFAAAAVAQGGGWGIFGDFIFADQNRHGQGIWTTLSGPMGGLANDLGKLTIGNIQELVKGEDTQFSSEIVGMLSKYTPGSSLWYGRLALERLVMDQLQRLTDPKADKKFRSAARKRYKDYGQKSWWRKGQITPSRLPQFENIIGR